MKILVVNTLILLLSIALPTLSHAQAPTHPTDDLIAPVLKHNDSETTAFMQAGHIFSATVTDDVGVATVTLFYRVAGAMTYESIKMNRLGNTDDFTAFIEPEALSTQGIEYYIQASDLAGNTLHRGTAFSPLKLAVSEVVTIAGETQDPQSSTISEPIYEKSDSDEAPAWTNQWIWVGLGAVLLGAAASSGG